MGARLLCMSHGAAIASGQSMIYFTDKIQDTSSIWPSNSPHDRTTCTIQDTVGNPCPWISTFRCTSRCIWSLWWMLLRAVVVDITASALADGMLSRGSTLPFVFIRYTWLGEQKYYFLTSFHLFFLTTFRDPSHTFRIHHTGGSKDPSNSPNIFIRCHLLD